MGATGNCYDNAMAESLFATLECELLQRVPFATREQAERELFAFIEGFYNRTRRHSALGYLSPVEFEAAWQAQQKAAGSSARHGSPGLCPHRLRATAGGGIRMGSDSGHRRLRAGTEAVEITVLVEFAQPAGGVAVHHQLLVVDARIDVRSLVAQHRHDGAQQLVRRR